MIRHLPNVLTCLNLLSGCLGIYSVFKFPEYPAAYFVWAACVFDFFDGFAARLLKVSSPIGKELDSLADMISFGALPSLAMTIWLSETGVDYPIAFIGFTIAVFSALRLAKFNVDENQKETFIGLPTPANAIFLTSLPFVPSALLGILSEPFSLIIITLVFSWLMVSPFELFALKFKNFGWRGNEVRFTFLLISVLLLVALGAGALPFIILLYLTISLTKNIWARG